MSNISMDIIDELECSSEIIDPKVAEEHRLGKLLFFSLFTGLLVLWSDGLK